MRIVEENGANIDEICEMLRNNGLVIFPCETTYGAAVDATSDEAIKKLSDYKKRPLGKPYSIMCADQTMAAQYVELNKTAKELYKKFLPGPVTIISKSKILSSKQYLISNGKLAKGVASELGTVGVRIPDYPFLIKLIKGYGRPLTATSANASYKKRPYKIADVLDNLSEKQKGLIGLIVDAGELPHNEPSTVIDTTLDDLVVLRQGETGFRVQSSVFSRSWENTQNIGKELWQKYEKYAGQRAIIFALEGEMGSGKTQLVKGMARAMGIRETVVSPTFNLNVQYSMSNVQYKLEHFDAWRMQNWQELEELDFGGLIQDKSVIAIEWADRVADTIRKYNEEAIVVWVKIKYRKKKNEREISWGTL